MAAGIVDSSVVEQVVVGIVDSSVEYLLVAVVGSCIHSDLSVVGQAVDIVELVVETDNKLTVDIDNSLVVDIDVDTDNWLIVDIDIDNSSVVDSHS